MTAPWRMDLFTTRDVPPSVLQCERDLLWRWYRNTPEEIDAAYAPFEARTAFLAVRRATDDGSDDVTVGFARLIANSPLGTRTLADLAAPPWDLDPQRCLAAAGVDPAGVWDIATLGARPDAGHGGLAGMAVYHGILRTLTVNGARTLVAIVDPRVRRLLAAVGLACRTLPGTGPAVYMGSAGSTPVYADVAATIDEQRRTSPDAYRLVTLGAGLGAIALPPREALVVHWDDAPRVADLRDAEAVPRTVALPDTLPAQPDRAASR